MHKCLMTLFNFFMGIFCVKTKVRIESGSGKFIRLRLKCYISISIKFFFYFFKCFICVSLHIIFRGLMPYECKFCAFKSADNWALAKHKKVTISCFLVAYRYRCIFHCQIRLCLSLKLRGWCFFCIQVNVWQWAYRRITNIQWIFLKVRCDHFNIFIREEIF